MPVTEDTFAGYPHYVVEAFQASATRKMQVAWTDIDQFVAETFPPATVLGGAIIFGLGAPFPGRFWLRAVKMNIEPMTNKMIGLDAVGEILYDEALCTIEYETPKSPLTDAQAEEDGDPVPGLVHRVTIGGEYLTLPETSLLWDKDNGKVSADTNAAKIVVQLEHSIAWPTIIRPPFTAIRNTIGKVNDAAFVFATGTIPAESALFLGAEVSRDVMSDGARAWTLNYRISERIVEEAIPEGGSPPAVRGGWNHFWRQEKDGKHGFQRLKRRNPTPTAPGSGYNVSDAIFTQTDFTPLFQPEP